MKGSNTEAVKRENGRNILNTIYMQGPISRIEISQLLGLTPPTITGYVTQFLKSGLIVEKESAPQAEAQMGRRRTDLDIAARSSYVIGIDVGPHSTYMILSDLRGNAVIRESFPVAPPDYNEAVKHMARGVEQMLSESGMRKKDISGIGIGIPGYVQSDYRTLAFSSVYDWKDVDIAGDMEELTGIRTLLINNARARSIAIEMFSDMDISDVYTYILVAKGIAAPSVVGSHELMPFHVSPGELGHIVLDREGHVFEHVAGEDAILSRCRALMENGDSPVLSSIADPDRGIRMQDVIEAQREGDVRIGEIVTESISYLGIAIANLVNVFNPPMVIIDAESMALEENRETLLSHARNNLYSSNRGDLEFRFTEPDTFRTALGAAGFVIKLFVLMEAGASIIKI